MRNVGGAIASSRSRYAGFGSFTARANSRIFPTSTRNVPSGPHTPSNDRSTSAMSPSPSNNSGNNSDGGRARERSSRPTGSGGIGGAQRANASEHRTGPRDHKLISCATSSRFQVASPKVTSEPLARLKYRCMSCSQVKPMPPWIWMPSPATKR